jgi:hypothetical protein
MTTETGQLAADTDHTPPLVGGLDLSLTASGIAWAGLYTGATKLGREGITTLRLPQKVEAIRVLGMRIVQQVCTPHHPDGSSAWGPGRVPALVVIEAPDVSRSYGGLVERLWLHYEVVRGLEVLGVALAHLPSGLVKGYGTGNGGSGVVDGLDAKKRMVAAVLANWPEYDRSRRTWSSRALDHNESEAATLAQAGLHWLTGVGAVPASHFAYVQRPTAQWPEREEIEL